MSADEASTDTERPTAGSKPGLPSRLGAGNPNPRIQDRELEALRRHSFGVAYRMLGSVTDAEDVAQEALLRLAREQSPLAEPAAWITTVTTRLSINLLKSARVRRESYVGSWLPEPLLENLASGPASQAELTESLSLAMLVLLERLSPVERAAYLLREVFAYEYAAIAEIIEQNETNTRQLVSRARKHLDADRPRFDPDEAVRDALLERFLAAAEEGDLGALEEILARDAILYADSGGKAVAPLEPLVGAALIASFVAAVYQARSPAGSFKSKRVRVNGQPGRLLLGPAERPPAAGDLLEADRALELVRARKLNAQQLAALVKDSREADQAPATQQTDAPQSASYIWSVLTVDVIDGRIQTVRIVRNPDKLAHL